MVSTKPLQDCGRWGQGGVLLHWHSSGNWNWPSAAFKAVVLLESTGFLLILCWTGVTRVATFTAHAKSSCPWCRCSHISLGFITRASADGFIISPNKSAEACRIHLCRGPGVATRVRPSWGHPFRGSVTYWDKTISFRSSFKNTRTSRQAESMCLKGNLTWKNICSLKKKKKI